MTGGKVEAGVAMISLDSLPSLGSGSDQKDMRRMMRGRTLLLAILACCAAGLAVLPAMAQQQPGGWQSETLRPGQVLPGTSKARNRAASRVFSKARRGSAARLRRRSRTCPQHHGGAAHTRGAEERRHRPGVAAGHADRGRAEHRAGARLARLSRHRRSRRQGEAGVDQPRSQSDAQARCRRLFRQRGARPCQPDAQDHGAGRARLAGALRAQRRRAAPRRRARQRRGGEREDGQLRHLLRRARPVRPARAHHERAAARHGGAPQRRHLQHRQHLRRRQRGGSLRRDGGGGQAHGSAGSTIRRPA